MTKLSILGLTDYDPTVWEDLVLPEQENQKNEISRITETGTDENAEPAAENTTGLKSAEPDAVESAAGLESAEPDAAESTTGVES